jgi:hypothetical protein
MQKQMGMRMFDTNYEEEEGYTSCSSHGDAPRKRRCVARGVEPSHAAVLQNAGTRVSKRLAHRHLSAQQGEAFPTHLDGI